jgi:formiminotetrahydrofolate cyclodeaminase
VAGTPEAAGAAPVRVGRAVWLSAATMSSRVLGLVRDQLFAILIGANRFSDAFVVAFRIPNLLRDLFAEGALSSAFVPAFADAHRNRGREAAYRLANTVVALVRLVVGAITLLGVAFAGPLVALMAPGYTADQAALAAYLTRIMMPFLLLVSLSAVAMGMLNAQGRFTAPAVAPALFNVGSIAVGLGLWLAGLPPERAVVGWSVGTLLGGALQLAAQLPSLRAVGYRARPALAGALAAALAEMALQYTVGKKQFEPQRDALIDAIDKLRKSAGLMQDLIREDISAYADLSRFLKLPPEQRNSDPNYMPAIVAAIRSPQAVGGLVMHILELSETLLDKCNPQLISDLGVASALAHATVHAAELNVLVNLRLLPNEEEAANLKKRTRDL